MSAKIFPKFKSACLLLLLTVTVSGCSLKDADNLDVEESSSVTEAAIWEEKDEEIINKNTEILLECTGAKKEATESSVKKLYQCGCNEISEIIECENTGKCYSFKVKDIHNETFIFTMSYEGYLGPVQNEAGEYLYYEVDD